MKTKETSDRLGQEADRALEAFALWADSGQAIFRQGAEFAIKAVEEGTRSFAAFQAAGFEAAKDGQTWTQRVIREGLEESRKAAAHFSEGGKAAARAAQGLQTAGDQAAMQIRAVLGEAAAKVNDLYTPMKS